jgi:mRNA interferase MazF
VSARPSLRRGDFVLITFPFTDLTSQKLRPAVILGHSGGDDVIVGFITSQPSSAASPAECPLDPADQEFARTGLRVASRIRLDRLATLHRNLVQRRLGSVGPRTQHAIEAGLRYVFGL